MSYSLRLMCEERSVCVRACVCVCESSGAVRKLRWTSWAPIPNKPTVCVDVKQHFKRPLCVCVCVCVADIVLECFCLN